jgi:hypothetical protein
MEISDQELRALVRAAIARNSRGAVVSVSLDAAGPDVPGLLDRMHASHGRLPLAGGSDGDGACLIEPSVRCNHCGYCQSLGH